jgi:hypothetical protein
MNPDTILAALLYLFPHMSGHNRQCILDRRPRIIQQLEEVGRPLVEPGEMGVIAPREIVAAVAFAETHLGCDNGEGGNWGAPIDPQHRHTAGTHIHATIALIHGYQACHTWDGAIMRFRTGLCDSRTSPNPAVRAQGLRYLRSINRLVSRIQEFSDHQYEHDNDEGASSHTPSE